MTVDGDKLDDLSRQLGGVAVQLATITQAVAGVRDDIARQGAGHADHEIRLRALEAADPATHTARLNRHSDRLDALEQTKWRLAGAYAALLFAGGAGGAGLAFIVQALQQPHQ